MAGVRRKRYAKRRKKRMDRANNDLTNEQWEKLQQVWGGCAYCGTTEGTMQKDCVLALSRGGRYTLTNVVPSCRSCNASKCNSEVSTWMRRKKLDEPAFLLRWAHVSAELTTALGDNASPDA